MFQLPTIGKRKRRQYDTSNIAAAYEDVKKHGFSVYKAARLYGIPESTLRDRTLGLQPVADGALVNPGPSATFSLEEEALLIKHLDYMSSIGYGYSRQEFLNLAFNYALVLKKKTEDSPVFSSAWFMGFKKRWPDVRLAKPQKLSMVRAKATSRQVLDSYYEELGKVLSENDLLDCPERIWNIDETGIQMEHTPTNVVCVKRSVPQAITSNRGKNVTLIACGNAAGGHIPPYFVFPGKRWSEGLMEDTSPGAAGQMSETGWSNSAVFLKYLEEHFYKFVPLQDKKTLVMFDGHRSHINVTLKDWGDRHNIIFFVLPPHTSHVTQPLDVGCFGPLKNAYYAECQQYLRKHPGQHVTKYTVGRIACHAYNKAMTADNLISAFGKTGIFPFKTTAISEVMTAPSTIYMGEDNENNATTPPEPEKDSSISFLDSRKILKVQTEKPVKPRQPTVTGSMSDPRQVLKPLPTTVPPVKSAKPGKRVFVPPFVRPPSPQPCTSGLTAAVISDDDQSLSDSEVADSEKCCICNKFHPDKLNLAYIIEIVTWGQCDQCDHWTHLKFCTSVRCLRRGATFLCPHCDPATQI